ncbi:MAG: hypothetical protein XU12_C0006G0085 [Deltaproteobacteria bacterium CSP1-8]|nr:MAG: hypothetical protein XU12_C0006G0085 [Deltaproteobacteria bacterium CSP1-8]
MTNTAGRNETTHETSKGVDGGFRPGGGKGNRLFLITMVLLLGTGTVVAAGWFGGIFKNTPADNARVAGVVESADAVRIPLSALDSGKALFLETDLEGRQVHYFAVKSSDGVYRAAYDACDVCFRANRGYRQEGDLMVCNKCGQAFPSVKVNEVKGGCNPAPLARIVDGQSLVIRKGDLAAGKDYFPGKRS